MQATNRKQRALLPACQLHRHGALRLETRPDGRTFIEVVRIVNRGIQKKSIDLTAEEFAALDAALRESFGRTEPAVQLMLDLPRTRSEAGLEIPLPKAPHHAKPRRFRFARRGGKREG